MILEFDRKPLSEALTNGTPGILDGRAVSQALLGQLEPIVAQFADRQIEPMLAVVQVGDDDASSVYIRHKIKACEKIGIRSEHHHMGNDSSFSEVVHQLDQLNRDSSVHGVLLQLPLPGGMDSANAMMTIDPTKDVDGFHPINLGCLMSHRALLEPCTPRGVLTLLKAAGAEVGGSEAVVVGRSVIVGRPMATMLTRANATVTICHRHTVDLKAAVKRADIVVVATGVTELIAGDWIKEGATVIDVGINRKDGKLCGDVQFEEAAKRAAWITPVPGGVGPMTVATLLENTVRAACIHEQFVVRNGEVLSANDAGVHFETIAGLGITTLRRGASLSTAT